ncbi:MAG: hypothetical protein QOK49_1223, partial [Baekduia sp.]|nr:hypothetical protein [Baekduia sp.]
MVVRRGVMGAVWAVRVMGRGPVCGGGG